jgi:hypothetical protein
MLHHAARAFPRIKPCPATTKGYPWGLRKAGEIKPAAPCIACGGTSGSRVDATMVGVVARLGVERVAGKSQDRECYGWGGCYLCHGGGIAVSCELVPVVFRRSHLPPGAGYFGVEEDSCSRWR